MVARALLLAGLFLSPSRAFFQQHHSALRSPSPFARRQITAGPLRSSAVTSEEEEEEEQQQQQEEEEGEELVVEAARRSP